MRLKLAIPVLAALAATLASPASAQYARVYGPGYYYSPGNYGPGYRTRVVPGPYIEAPVPGPFFYNDGWVPESIYDHSRTGGIDPTIRPPGN